MAVCFKYIPVFLAINALQYWSVNAAEDLDLENYYTTWEVTKKVENCEKRTKIYDMVTVHYVGRVTETDQIFDNSEARGEPFDFQLGYGEVIKGWDVGLQDMCVGEERRLSIPYEEAYGKEGTEDGRIKPGAHLTYDVKLIKFEEGEAPPDVFSMMDTDGNRKIDKKEVYNYLKMKSEEKGSEDPEFGQDHDDVVDRIFESEDVDKDGVITRAEFSGPKGNGRHEEL